MIEAAPPHESCIKCGLWQTCKHPAIHGRGSMTAEVVFVGEAPGREEDEQGECFVGISGFTLDRAIEAIKLREDQVWRTNVIRCRPPENTLGKKRSRLCAHFLEDEIADIKPRVLVPLGGTALDIIVGGGERISVVHGRILEKDGYLIVPMFHPAHVLRKPSLQKDFERDLYQLKRALVYGKDPPAPVDVRIIRTLPDLLDAAEQITSRGKTSVDFETNFLKPWEHPDPKIGLIGFSLGTHSAAVVPLDHPEAPWEEEERPVVLAVLGMLLTDPAIVRVGQNTKYEITAAKYVLGIDATFARDTLLEFALVDEEAPDKSLDAIAWRHTDLGGYKEELVLPDPEDYLSATLADLAEYNARDVVVTERADDAFLAEMDPARQKILSVLQRVVPVLARMEMAGKAVDPVVVEQLDEEYRSVIAEVEAQMRAWPEVAQAEKTLAQRRLDDEVAKLQEVVAEKVDAAEREKDEKVQARLLKSAEYHANKWARLLEGGPGAAPWSQAFNFRSNDQLQVLFLDAFGYPSTGILTDGGAESTGKDALMVWAQHHAEPRIFRRYRRLATIHSGFIKPVPELLQTTDTRLHASFLLHVARTGRVASRSPNEQNRPRDGTCKLLGVSSVKSMYISRFPGGKLLQGDYSQLELRVLAVASRCKMLLGAYRTGRDVHSQTTLGMFPGLPWEGYAVAKTAAQAAGVDFPALTRSDVDALPFEDRVALAEMAAGWKEKRTTGKRCNFLVSYQGGPARLQAVLAEDGLYKAMDECQGYIETFFRLYPEVVSYMRGVTQRAIDAGGVVTAADGRRRHVAAIITGDEGEKAAAAREAGNFGIQWPAAKLTLVALTTLDEELRAAGARTVIVGTVHDSIQLDAPPDEADDALALLGVIMEAAGRSPEWMPEGWWDPTVPIVADLETVWGEKEEK